MPALFLRRGTAVCLPDSLIPVSLIPVSLVPVSLVPVSLVLLVFAAAWAMPQRLAGQMINVSSPYTRTSDSFFNRTGVNFGLSFGGGGKVFGYNAAGQITPSINITQGGAGAAIPPFGGYDPNAGLQTGVAVLGGDVGFSLGLVAGKGNTRSIVSRTPSVTVMNGQMGSIFSGQNRPFVTRITPVVGNLHFRPSRPPDSRPTNFSPRSYGNPNSTATRGALSLAEISRQKAREASAEQAELNAEIESLVRKARQLTEDGKFGAARAKYSRALRRLGESQGTAGAHAKIAAELDAIRDKR